MSKFVFKRKSPIDLLIGRAVKAERAERKLSDKVMAYSVGLKEGYLRGIEAGSFKCPSDIAHLLCETLRWNYQATASVLTAAKLLASANVKDNLKSKLAQLAALAPEFAYVWTWCGTCPPDSPLLTERWDTLRNSNADPSVLNEFDQLVNKLRADLKGRGRERGTAEAPAFSPFFLPAVDGFATALKALQETLLHAAPVVNAQGLRYFGLLHSDRIVGIEAFLSYKPTEEEFRGDDFHWDWLLKKEISPMIKLYMKKRSDLLELKLNRALHHRFGKQLTRDCVKIYVSKLPLERGFYFDMASLRASVGKPTGGDDLHLSNAWIYQLRVSGFDTYLAMLDNYDQSGRNVFGVSLDAKESNRLRSHLLQEHEP